ncbi:MAG: putative sensor-like histidine kinase [Bacteroidetes bacterium ADurb.Bin408]|nr:MAG: putative sensor-like histidine kinase [Bacteroidetes bacterium ADurb.Bin408]
MGTPKGLVKNNPVLNTWQQYLNQPNNNNSLSNNDVGALFQDKKGRLWVGTSGGGLNLYDYVNNTFMPFVNVPGKQNTLSNDFVNAITEDQQGNIWIGTSKGVNRMDNYRNTFEHFYNIPQKTNSLNNNTVWCIYETHNKEIWIGTDKGINIFDKKTGHFSFLTKSPNNQGKLPSNQIRTLYEDSYGEFWIGTFDAGICRLNASKKHIAYYNTNTKISLPDNQVWSITEDNNKDIWIGTFNGLAQYNRKTNTITSFHHDDKNSNSLSCNIIYHLLYDNNGYLWISTFNGLNKFDIKKKTFERYYHIPENYNSLSNNRIFSVYKDNENILWIATMGGGLNKYDFKTNTIKAYTEEEGMPNNIVYNILEDHLGNLWLSTNFGLSKFNKKNETFVNYDIRDGIQSSEFNLGAACKTSDGELLFGGMQGFNLFKPEIITENKHHPPVLVTAFKVFNKPHQYQYGNGDTIELSYHDNFFSFEFASLEFSNPDKIKYAFTLENFDKGWLYAEATRRYAEYTNIPPGVYTFRVKATDSQGLWLPETCHLYLIIHNVWWRSLWFKASIVLFILIIIALIIYDRYRKIRRKHRWEKQKLQLEKQLFDLKQKALSLQMNPHFIFNTLNAIQTFILKDNTDQAIQFMGKLSQLMRLILSSTREVYVPLINEVKILTYYLDLEKIRFNEKFDYTIHVDNAIDTEFTGVPPMLIQPFVENAVLHGIMHKKEKGHISIIFKPAKDNIHCIIKDDGIGREKSALLKKEKGLSHTSRGIAIIADRLSLFEEKNIKQKRIVINDLKNADGTPAGTHVEVFLPFIEL